MTARALILPDPGFGEEFKRWGLAAAIVCAAHFGLMAGYLLLPAPEPDGSMDSPVVIIDFAPVPVAPSSPDDIAPGPDMVEAQPTPIPPPQVEPEVVEPTPKMEAPTPAEVTLPEPKAVEQKSEQPPDAQKTETKEVQVQAAPAPQTTAAPRSEQNTAAVPQAPSPGSAATRAAIASWRDLIMARLQQNKRYPSSAESQRQQGVVTLSFTVDRNGRVLARKIAKSSGVTALDDEVMAMIERAQPLPAFPPAMPQSLVNLTVPIRFSLH
jgi:protein TonB